jgi:hypothetical protein
MNWPSLETLPPVDLAHIGDLKPPWKSSTRLFCFSREEPRSHVHVAHPDGEAKFWLTPSLDPGGPGRLGLNIR